MLPTNSFMRRKSDLPGSPIRRGLPVLCAVVFFSLVSIPTPISAHGIAGKRFFPTTLAVDDPFVSDELSFLFGHIKEPGEESGSPVKTTTVSVDYSKRITKNWGLSIGEEFRHLEPGNGDSENGFGNLELGLKYQFFKSDAHEAILSVGLDAEIGGTGRKAVGAESFSILSPTLFFGKGLGDLPENAKFLKPFAITGSVGLNVPTRRSNVITTVNGQTGEIDREVQHNPTTLSWGFTLQYHLHYLQSYVKDVGLNAPLNKMILVVEFPFETCLSNDCKGKTTGFINPGILWFGKAIQLGLEARIPVNTRTGRHVGVLGLVHFFLDDLFPKSLGRPIFGN